MEYGLITFYANLFQPQLLNLLPCLKKLNSFLLDYSIHVFYVIQSDYHEYLCSLVNDVFKVTEKTQKLFLVLTSHSFSKNLKDVWLHLVLACCLLSVRNFSFFLCRFCKWTFLIGFLIFFPIFVYNFSECLDTERTGVLRLFKNIVTFAHDSMHLWQNRW